MHRVPGSQPCFGLTLLDPQSTLSLGIRQRFGVFTLEDRNTSLEPTAQAQRQGQGSGQLKGDPKAGITGLQSVAPRREAPTLTTASFSELPT